MKYAENVIKKGKMNSYKFLLRSLATKSMADGELMALKLYVSNLPWTISKRELQNYFSQFGPITKAEVMFDKETGFSRGFGFVTFELSKSYVKALETKEHILESKQLQINPAKHIGTFRNLDDDI